MSDSRAASEKSVAWSVILLLVSLATAAPFFAVRFLPFTDLPEHVAAIATLARLLPGGGGDPDYVFSSGQSQYLLYDLAGALLVRLLGDALLANRVLLAMLAVAWPYAFRSLLRALGRDERLAIFAPMLFWSRALTIGFLPFIGSVPLTLVALATLIRQIEKPTRSRAAILAVLAVLLFYAHVSTYVLLGVAGAVMVVARVGKDWKRAALTLVPLVPSALCALLWWSAGSLDRNDGGGPHVARLSPGAALDAAPVWSFDLWRSHADELWACIWWTAFGLAVLDGLRRKPDASTLRSGAFALVPFACTLIVYLVTPFSVGPAGYLDVRLAPLLGLFSVLILRPSSGHLVRVQLAAAAIAAVGTAGTATFEMRRLEREMLGDFSKVLDAMRPDTRLATLNFEARSPRAYLWPYAFAGSYHRLKPGTIAGYSFTELPHWPLHYAGGHAPPQPSEFWAYRPCAFRHRADAAYYDYILVQGRYDPFASEHPGPAFEPIASSGNFTLFAKNEKVPEANADAPDRSVCRRRPAPDAAGAEPYAAPE